MSALLTVTQAAAEALDSIVASADEVPDTAGLRIVQGDAAPDGRTTFGLSLVESPEPSDQVVETGHAPVFVDSDAADLLDDQVLDAQITGDHIAFVLGRRG